jgi:hypothetical protein
MERFGIGANKALLSRFPLSEKKASSSASDPHLPISLLYPNFLPVSLDLLTRNGLIWWCFGVEEGLIFRFRC